MDTASGVAPPRAMAAAFAVRAAADANIVARLLALFAQRDLIPDMMRMRRHGCELAIDIFQPAVAEPAARIMAEKMRAIVAVHSVELAFRSRPDGPGSPG